MEKEEMEVTVNVRSTRMVAPSIMPHPARMFLPALDAWWLPLHYNRRLLFYKVNHFQSAVDLLESSLEKVLVDFYPWTGRLALSPVDGRLVIDFEGVDRGVEFVEAYTDDVAYSELSSDGFQLRPFFDKFAKWSHHDPSQAFNIPLLSIQVTKLKDKGMVLGYAHNHVVADGHSMWHFMKSWSECARGSPISIPPLHRRELLCLDNPSKDLAISLFEGVQSNSNENTSISPSANGGALPMAQRLFRFTAEMIRRLKDKALSEVGGTFSSYQVLAAHFWQCVTRARCLESRSYVHFIVLANCRKRLNPCLPPSYFANCIAFKIVQTTAGELTEDTLAKTASRISEASKSCATPNYFWGLAHWIELLTKNSSLYNICRHPNSAGMIIASSPHFPCYEVDFGLFGRPEAVRTALVKGNGEMVVFPRSHNNDGSIDICMSLPPCSMDRLLKDPQFLNF